MSERITCEMMEGDQAGEVTAVIKDQLRAMKLDGLVEALSGVPCTVFRLEDASGVEAVAFIGFEPEDVKHQRYDRYPFKPGTELKFEVQERDGYTYDSVLYVPDVPSGSSYFNRGGWGKIKDVNLLSHEGTAGFVDYRANLSHKIPKEGLDLPGNIIPSKFILLKFSEDLAASITQRNIPFPGSFAIVQEAIRAS